MLKAEQVPDDVAEAAFKKWCEIMSAPELGCVMKESIAAAINAWPEMYHYPGDVNQPANAPAIILPLQQETGE